MHSKARCAQQLATFKVENENEKQCAYLIGGKNYLKEYRSKKLKLPDKSFVYRTVEIDNNNSQTV